MNDLANALNQIPDEILAKLSFILPWQPGVINTARKDPDGKPAATGAGADESIAATRAECWSKFNRNPQVSTAIRGLVGRITGWGFEATSEIQQIQDAITEIEYDQRNRLYGNWPKYVGRTHIDGELFLLITVHVDGFCEVDFIDPDTLEGGTDGLGIIFHPKKRTMPVVYCVKDEDAGAVAQIPSVFVARFPSIINDIDGQDGFSKDLLAGSVSKKRQFKRIGGYYRFVLAWDRGFVTRRAISYLRTVIEWLNLYEDLKRFEIDHKRSAGSYAWVFSFEDTRAFKLWVGLSEEERKKTALMAPIVPGSKLFVPPGMKVEAKNPNLPNISDSDTDIMQMAISGLNEAADVTTGTVKGTYASVKATRGPMSDRTSDEIAWFDRFYRFDFWANIFFLKSAVAGFPETFEVEEAVAFENGKPKFAMVKRRPEFLVDVSYPVSETIDMEARAKAVLGVKHGPVTESIGVPPSEAARKIGFGGYGRNRLRKATEDKKYPKLVYSVDAETLQEKTEGEKPKEKQKQDNPRQAADKAA